MADETGKKPGSETESPSGHRVEQSDDTSTTVAQMRAWMQEFVRERCWERYHTPKNLSMALAIEAAEVMEHFQWLSPEESLDPQCFDKDAVAEEIADVTCFLLSLTNALEIDLTSAVRQKMARNRVKYPVSADSATRWGKQ